LRCSSIPNDLLKAYYEKWYCFVSRTSNFILNCRPYTDMVPDVTPPVNLLSAYELDLYERHLFPHPTITGVKSPFDAYQTYINMSEQPKSGLRRKNLRPYLNLGSRRSAKVHKRTSNQDDTEQLSTRNSKVSAVQFSPVRTSDPVISVYRLLIRPAILEMKEGGITARLRYIIQLHKRITGYYRLIIEVRLSPEFPPIFVGFLSLEWITVDLRCSSIPNDLLKAYYEKWYCFVSRTSNFILNCRPYTDMVPDVTPPVNLLSAYELDLYERHLFPHPTITGVKSPFDAYQTYINMSEQPKSGLRRKNLRPYLNLGSRRSAKVHKRTSNQDDTEQLSTRNSKVSAVQFSPVRTSDPVISVYRLLIRPAILEMKEGGITARLRYIIQLHKRITGYYRLIIEVRLSPEFPPIFV
ncbi:hypothetical protein T265_14972, partial [Opisthorchis viverrini]